MLTQTIIENHERVYLCPINEYKKNLVYNKIALFFFTTKATRSYTRVFHTHRCTQEIPFDRFPH